MMLMLAQIAVYKSLCKHYRKHADADRPDSELRVTTKQHPQNHQSHRIEFYCIVCGYYISDGNRLTTGHTSAGLKWAPRNVCRDLFHPSSKVIFLKLTLVKNFSEWLINISPVLTSSSLFFFICRSCFSRSAFSLAILAFLCFSSASLLLAFSFTAC